MWGIHLFLLLLLLLFRCRVCSVNFESPTESPWTNAVLSQLWLLRKWHLRGTILQTKLAQDCPIGKRQLPLTYWAILGNLGQALSIGNLLFLDHQYQTGGSNCEMFEIRWHIEAWFPWSRFRLVGTVTVQPPIVLFFLSWSWSLLLMEAKLKSCFALKEKKAYWYHQLNYYRNWAIKDA